MLEYGRMFGRYPAIVRSYDQQRRTCRIEIPGSTDGGDVWPEAEIEYPLGDKSRDGENTTEIEILPGDTVWIEFIGGDERYPIIIGNRNPQVGNSFDMRRWHHENMELIANVVMKMIAGGDITIESGTKITIKAPEILMDTPITTFTGDIAINGNGSTSATINGNISVSGDVNAVGAVNDGGGNSNHHSH